MAQIRPSCRQPALAVVRARGGAGDIDDRLYGSELYLVTGDVKAASAVARKGLAISPLNKSLWMTYLTVEAERDVHHLQLAKDWMDRTFASEAEPYDTVDAELQQLTAELLAQKSS